MQKFNIENSVNVNAYTISVEHRLKDESTINNIHKTYPHLISSLNHQSLNASASGGGIEAGSYMGSVNGRASWDHEFFVVGGAWSPRSTNVASAMGAGGAVSAASLGN